MDFFEAQDRAREATKRLIVIYLLVTALIGKGMAGAKIDVKKKIAVGTLHQSMDVLIGLNGKGRRTLLLAICETAAHDGSLSVAEGELIRVICASLDCPSPPIFADNR